MTKYYLQGTSDREMHWCLYQVLLVFLIFLVMSHAWLMSTNKGGKTSMGNRETVNVRHQGRRQVGSFIAAHRSLLFFFRFFKLVPRSVHRKHIKVGPRCMTQTQYVQGLVRGLQNFKKRVYFLKRAFKPEPLLFYEVEAAQTASSKYP